jgi:hypothetical protein
MAFPSFSQNVPFGCFVSKNFRKVDLFKWKFCEVLLWCKRMTVLENALWVGLSMIVSLPFEQIMSVRNMFMVLHY